MSIRTILENFEQRVMTTRWFELASYVESIFDELDKLLTQNEEEALVSLNNYSTNLIFDHICNWQ